MTDHIWPVSISNYNYLIDQPKSAWAWEFLRRNADYRSDAIRTAQSSTIRSSARNGLRITRLLGHQSEAEAWGLCSFRRSGSNNI